MKWSQLNRAGTIARGIERLAGAIGVIAISVTSATAQIHTSHDHIPDFCASPSISSARSGAWGDPATWSPARVPGAGDNVRIAAGTTVTFDAHMASAAACVGIDGTLTFSRSMNTRLWAGNVMVYAAGSLEVGTAAQPIPDAVRAEIVIANRPLNTTSDPDQYGTALIAFGTVRISGMPKTPTWTRLASEPRVGQTSLTLSQAVSGWKAGDRIILPDTRHMKWNEVTSWAPTAPQWEELTVQAISGDGSTLTISPALRFDHLGARDGDNALNFLPHVGNLTRNVVIRSEIAIGSAGTLGHTMFTSRANVDVRYALFKDLGRTTNAPLDNTANHIGRYPIHAHHLFGPTTTPASGYQFTLLGNAIDGGSTNHRFKWGIAIHDSHYGLIKQNVLYNWAGSLVMFEDGSESFNVVEGNFAVRSKGTGDRLVEGVEGGGFWFKGPNNYVRGNVAADLWGDTTEAAYGFSSFMRLLGNIKVPNFKGADTTVAGQYTTVNGNNLPILEFSDNEVYSAAQGVTYWWISSQDPQPYANARESVISNTRIWHVYNKAVYHYPAAKITFDNLVIRGKDPANSACCGHGFLAGDYSGTNITFRNIDIQGMGTGIQFSTVAMGGLQVIENSYMRNVVDLEMVTLYSTNGGSWIPPRKVIARNVRFATWPGSSHKAINMNWNPKGSGQGNTTQRDELFVYRYNGVSSDNFQAYYTEQGTQNLAGGIAPCRTTRAELDGIACTIAPEAGGGTAPAPPTNLRVVK